MYGMKYCHLTEDVLKDILLIYKKIVAGSLIDLMVFSKSSPPMSERLNWIKEGFKSVKI